MYDVDMLISWVEYDTETGKRVDRMKLTHWGRDEMDASDTFKRIFMNENVRISIDISLKFVPKGLINNIPALVQMRRRGKHCFVSRLMRNETIHIYIYWYLIH